MAIKTIILATAFAVTSSIALAQPAPIGSDADVGNRALINRGPVTTTGEDLDFQRHRSMSGSGAWHHRAHAMKHRRRHVAERR
jgi:hypothetical protein